MHWSAIQLARLDIKYYNSNLLTEGTFYYVFNAQAYKNVHFSTIQENLILAQNFFTRMIETLQHCSSVVKLV